MTAPSFVFCRRGRRTFVAAQKGVRMGALLMLTCFLIALVQALMPSLIGKLVVLAAPVIIGFFVGFVRLLYALFFRRKGCIRGTDSPIKKRPNYEARPPRPYHRAAASRSPTGRGGRTPPRWFDR